MNGSTPSFLTKSSLSTLAHFSTTFPSPPLQSISEGPATVSSQPPLQTAENGLKSVETQAPIVKPLNPQLQKRNIGDNNDNLPGEDLPTTTKSPQLPIPPKDTSQSGPSPPSSTSDEILTKINLGQQALEEKKHKRKTIAGSTDPQQQPQHQQEQQQQQGLQTSHFTVQGHMTKLNQDGFILNAPTNQSTLKDELQALVEEATKVSIEQNIPTDFDAAQQLQLETAADAAVKVLSHWGEHDPASGLSEAEKDIISGTGSPSCQPEDCRPHGICGSNSNNSISSSNKWAACDCVALYHGKHCGHGVLLSWPYLPSSAKHFVPTFEGEMVMVKETLLFQHHYEKNGGLEQQQEANDSVFSELQKPTSHNLKLHHNWKREALADRRKAKSLVLALPEEDSFLQGRAFPQCAVVGGSGALLLHESGSTIDQHYDAVFRTNKAVTSGVYSKYTGTKTTFRVTSGPNAWGFRENNDEIVLLRSLNDPKVIQAAVEGLIWNANNNKSSSSTLLVTNPYLEDHLASGLSYKPSTGLITIILAAHSCQKVTLYGFGLGRGHGVLPTYHDPCSESDAAIAFRAQRDGEERELLVALVESGIVSLGEPCVMECIKESSTAECGVCRRSRGVQVGRPDGLPSCSDVTGSGKSGSSRNYKAPWL
jgi:hypothetical protein